MTNVIPEKRKKYNFHASGIPKWGTMSNKIPRKNTIDSRDIKWNKKRSDYVEFTSQFAPFLEQIAGRLRPHFPSIAYIT